MLVFPQLFLPLTKKNRQRSVVNTLGDGRTDVYSDADAASLAWELDAKGLTAMEWQAVETLFAATAGRWKSFTFLDPAGNLLAESENFGASAWINGALVDFTTGGTDPFGTTRATAVVNVGAGAEFVAQTLAIPGNYHYCLSAWARTTSGSSVTLTMSTAGGNAMKTFALGTQWARISLSANLGQSTQSVTFGAQLAAAASIDLFGMQVEAQFGASDYKQTGTTGGVHSNARFGADTITVTAQGTDVYDAVVEIVNTES